MRGNKKGPENMGPKTGRGLGYCNGNDTPGYMSNEAPQEMKRGYGSGMGRGRGMGRGFGRGAGRFGQNFQQFNDESEISDIRTRLDSIEKMLKELKK
jgi:uncharacterized protein DUF5320